MRCRHKNVDHAGPDPVRFPPYARARFEAAVCLGCGSWLPLGQANDEPEAVKVEIRAAEIAAMTAPQRHRPSFMGGIGWDEQYGWDSNQFSWEPSAKRIDSGFHAGYLARCIAKHEEG